MTRSIKSFLKSILPFKGLFAWRHSIRPGHFYSPIPSMEEVRRRKATLFDRSLRALPGVDLNVEGQLQLLDRLAPFYGEQPFSDEPSGGLRYSFNNDYFTHSDAIFLYCMIRHAQPKRIIEIGSGFSSFVMLDTNERFFDNRIRLTFIEPNDQRLRSRLKEKDFSVTDILSKPVQEVALSRFDGLEAGDILFVDSSHVVKVGSDVNHILFAVLPRLPKGVYVHFHDVFYPFEYPVEFLEEGRYWSEDYILRAFLQFNSAFKVRIWNEFLAMFHPDKLEAAMPLCMKNTGGSLWLERV